MTSAATLTAGLRAHIETTFGELLTPESRVALVDFPNHANVGDSAIWLGEIACLRSLGIRDLRYTCDLDSYGRRGLAAAGDLDAILIHGGGNLGDLWEPHQRLRETIIADFPLTRIIQLPQTVHFETREALSRARAVMDAHPDLTLLVRDRRSLEIAGNEFRAPSRLCPDSALYLGPLARSTPPSRETVWLLRADKEAAEPRPPEGVRIRHEDWLGERPGALATLAAWLGRATGGGTPFHRSLTRLLAATYLSLAQRRTDRGVRVLSRSRVVVTDRLHAHILCLLLEIPHVLVDNSYGKLRSFFETWTHGCPLALWADSWAEAADLAARQTREAARAGH